ncbi:hypothetical protein ID866_5579 [Astraeus odoratus]|nr:hypothetical protein ID866_5579 [Astraeus odoratus]
MAAAFDDLLDALAVPAAFSRHDKITDETLLADLQVWKSNLLSTLSRVGILLPASSTAEQAKLVKVLAPLTAVAVWTTPESRSLATKLLSTCNPTPALVTFILANIVKPLFAATPHPRLHTATARVLVRPADTQDTYYHQPWKDHPGLNEVIRWCILNTQSSAYERTWPLILPPVMTFLDDYQVPFKILGVRLVSTMLTRAPSELLIRTGVDALMFTSLTNALNHLRDPSTPDLIRAAVSTTLQLIDLTTPSLFLNTCPSPLPSTYTSDGTSLSPSDRQSLSTRFKRLSTLLSSSILGTVIMYTPAIAPPEPTPIPDSFSDPENLASDSMPEPSTIQQMQVGAPDGNTANPTLVAAAQVLPLVIAALGIGVARFLKGLVPVASGWLALPIPTPALSGAPVAAGTGKPLEHSTEDIDRSGGEFLALHIAALYVLRALFRACAPRMERWTTTITDGLARCWVGCVDVANNNTPPPGIEVLKDALQEIVGEFANTCPRVIKNEFRQLLDFDKELFGGLVGNICAGSGIDGISKNCD